MKIKYKRGSKARPAQIADNIEIFARQTAGAVEDDYVGVVENWNTNVEFSVEDRSSGDDLVFNVYARGVNADIFKYVDRGTDKRYAVMRPTFVPRTTPGSLRSVAAGGNRRPSYFDYDPVSASSRRIEAREFGKTIVENRIDSFVAGIREMMRA